MQTRVYNNPHAGIQTRTRICVKLWMQPNSRQQASSTWCWMMETIIEPGYVAATQQCFGLDMCQFLLARINGKWREKYTATTGRYWSHAVVHSHLKANDATSPCTSKLLQYYTHNVILKLRMTSKDRKLVLHMYQVYMAESNKWQKTTQHITLYFMAL